MKKESLIGRSKLNWPAALALVIVLLTCFFVMEEIAPYKQPLPSTDSGIFLYMGEKLLDGQLLYRDAWDHKGPIVFLINAIGLTISRQSLWGIWLGQFATVAIAAGIGYRLMARLFGLVPALFGSVLWLLELRWVLDGGNLTEVYALPFQFATLWFFYDAYSNNNNRAYIWMGFCAAMAFWLRANIIGGFVAIGLVLVWQWFRSRSRATLFPILAVAVGWLGVAVVIFVWFGLQDNLAGLVDATFTFNFVYSDSTLQEKWDALLASRSLLPAISTFGLLGWGLLLSKLTWAKSNQIRSLKAFWSVLAIALPLDLLLVSMSGRIYPHYYMSLLPVASILAASFLSELLAWAKAALPSSQAFRQTRRFLLAGLLLPIAILPAMAFFSSGASLASSLVAGGLPASNISARSERVLAYIYDNIEDGQGLLLWGKNLTFNWATKRPVPSRHIFQDHFFATGYASSEMIDGYIDDIYTNRPLIIDTTESNNFVPPINTSLLKLPWVVLPLYRFLQRNYERVELIPGTDWAVYRFVGEQN